MYWQNGHSLQNGKFTIETVLGQGGFGITYKALHRGFNAPVVIKTPNAFLRHDPDYAKYVQRFIREAQILAQLESNPNPHIVRVKDLFEESDSHCLVMEFIEGKNLYTLVQEQGPLSEATALELICPVAQALAQVHRAGIVHRDATPVNIMLRGNGQPVLIDFGIAGNVVPSVTSSKIFGNQAFAPYEQLIKGDRSPTVDIYTLAASLYYAVTKQLPRDCFSRKVDREELVPPKDLASVSDAINDAIMAGMALNKTQRPQSMEEWLKLLEPPKPTPLYRPKTTSFSFDIVTVNSKGREINRRTGQAECIIEDLGNGVTLEMVKIPGGTFIMGASSGEAGSYNTERPQHRVTIKPFLMGKYPVTQEQWRQVASFPKLQRDLSPDPSYFQGLNLPVESVSWYDVIEWCARLSKRIGKPYRLPSEAEWEYAARAGTNSPFHVGDTLTTDLANYRGNYAYSSGPKGAYREQTTPVGQFQHANAFGLYDIHGNVWEWCADPGHNSYNGAPSDGGVWDVGNDNRYQKPIEYLVKFLGSQERRVLRGGSWYSYPENCRCAYGVRFDPDDLYINYGFRGACAPPTLSP
ncbi:serine/threonine protein kinase [Arthrospira platensis C1]|nr:serine/threonine protein kinase [Arthrospira platensis C1]